MLDAAGAEAAVAAAHYPPRGRRGLALSTRAGRYGAVSLDDHLRRAAAETCVIVQIEDREAVAAADAILAVPGVSAVLIGASDLAMSLGHPPEAEIERVIAAAARAGVPVMTVANSIADVRRPRRAGGGIRIHEPDPRRVPGGRRGNAGGAPGAAASRSCSCPACSATRRCGTRSRHR